MTRPTVVFVALTALVGASPPAFAEDKAALDGGALFEKKCGACHGLERPKGKKKPAADWEKTVKRMRSNGAALTDDEAKAIIDFLSKNYGS